MEEKQLPTRLGGMLERQTSSVSKSEKTLATRPSWTAEITQRYGSFVQFSNRFSYARMDDIVQVPSECFRRESPTLVRIDITYGRGSSASWLYDLLQSMFIFFGVTSERFSKEQVFDLARTIASQYKTLKVAEILLFVARFKAGKYGKFYGDTSYALTVTDALNQFMVEREHHYADIEREKRERITEEGKQGTITLEEYKRMKEARGEKVSDALDSLFGNNS